jgi:hypothetical protein
MQRGTFLGTALGAVARLDYRTTQQRAVPVEKHLAGIVLWAVVGPHPPPPPVGAHQRVLGQFLGLAPVPGQPEPQAAQLPELACEELLKFQVLRHRHPDEVR